MVTTAYLGLLDIHKLFEYSKDIDKVRFKHSLGLIKPLDIECFDGFSVYFITHKSFKFVLRDFESKTMSWDDYDRLMSKGI